MNMALEQINPREQSRDDSLVIGTTVVMVAEPRTGINYRQELLLRNVSTDPTMIISISTAPKIAAVNEGIVLRQYESVGWSRTMDYFPPQGAVTAICAVAGGALTVHER
jgi:hypothetical protein